MASLTRQALERALTYASRRKFALWAERSAGWVPIDSDELLVARVVPQAALVALPPAADLSEHLALYSATPLAPSGSQLLGTQYAVYNVEAPAQVPQAEFLQPFKPQGVKGVEIYDLAQRLGAKVVLVDREPLPPTLRRQLPPFSETQQASVKMPTLATPPPRTGQEGQVGFVERYQKQIVGVIVGGLAFALGSGLVRRMK